MKNDSSLVFTMRNNSDGLPQLYTCYTTCEIPPSKIVNPYVRGFRGIWRKKRDRLFYGHRNDNQPVRKAGIYAYFTPFINYIDPTNGWKADGLDYYWPWTSEVTKYSSQGIEIENRDALHRYSAAIYGYGNTLPIGVASNAKYGQIAYDGFEDYRYINNNSCDRLHWGYKHSQDANATLDTTVRHTGRHSLRIGANHSASVARKIYDCSNDMTVYTGDEYQVTPCNCVGVFSPDTGQKYVISGWVKLDTTAMAASYPTPYIIVSLDGDFNVSKAFHASGPVIEGWQRIEGEFYIPLGKNNITVTLMASQYSTTWFDDLRIFPFHGDMKTYAYDERTLKLLGELDENNYATIYEYDEQGALVRVKKETIEGIMTLKENRNSSFKK